MARAGLELELMMAQPLEQLDDTSAPVGAMGFWNLQSAISLARVPKAREWLSG